MFKRSTVSHANLSPQIHTVCGMLWYRTWRVKKWKIPCPVWARGVFFRPSGSQPFHSYLVSNPDSFSFKWPKHYIDIIQWCTLHRYDTYYLIYKYALIESRCNKEMKRTIGESDKEGMKMETWSQKSSVTHTFLCRLTHVLLLSSHCTSHHTSGCLCNT